MKGGRTLTEILMPTDLVFVCLHIELNLYFVTIFFVFLHIFRCDHELYNEYHFKDIKVN